MNLNRRPKRKKAVPLALKLALVILSPCVFLVGLEMVLRLATTGSAYFSEKNPHYLTESGRWMLRPGENVWWYGCRYNVNGDGFRMEHEVLPEKRVRVLALGDSVTLGMGVRRTRDVWPNRLEAMANAHFAGGERQIEVLNAGVQGRDLLRADSDGRMERWDYVPALEEALERYKPDAVIYCICLNDVPSRVSDLFTVNNDANRKRFAFFPEQSREWLKRKAFYRLARDLYRENCFSELDFSAVPTPPTDAAFWDRVSEELGALRSLCEKSGAEMFAVMLPFSYQVLPQHEELLQLNAQWQDVLDDQGIPWADITTHFTAENVLEYYALGDHIHPNAKGHQVIADEALRLLGDHLAALAGGGPLIGPGNADGVKETEPLALRDAGAAR